MEENKYFVEIMCSKCGEKSQSPLEEFIKKNPVHLVERDVNGNFFVYVWCKKCGRGLVACRHDITKVSVVTLSEIEPEELFEIMKGM